MTLGSFGIVAPAARAIGVNDNVLPDAVKLVPVTAICVPIEPEFGESDETVGRDCSLAAVGEGVQPASSNRSARAAATGFMWSS
jgi:hypothetical protein